MRRHVLIALLCLSVSPLGCAPKGPQRPPELEAAHRQMEQSPQDPDSYLRLARLYLYRGDYLRGRQYLALGERFPRHDVEQAFRLGVVLAVRAGVLDEAIRRCRQALERKEDVTVRLLLSNVLEAAGRWGEAQVEREMVLAESPADGHQLIEMARFYERSGRPRGEQRAAEYYQRYLASAPAGPEAPQARAALRSLALSQSESASADAPQRTN